MKFNTYLNKKFVYCDMDGVLCDWWKAFTAIGGRNGQGHVKLSSEEWKTIERAGEDFWTFMPWMKDGKKLWSYLNIHFNDVFILSSPTRDPLSRTGKKKWVRRELGSNVIVYLESNKGIYANKNSILIDDKKQNITDWEKNDGIGILHKSTESTIKKLESSLC